MRGRGAAFVGLDAGTSAVKAVLFDGRLAARAEAAVPVATAAGAAGRAEQDPSLVVRAAATAVRRVLRKAGVPAAGVAALGLCVHRSSCVALDVATGRFVSPLVLWNDRRAAADAGRLAASAAGRRLARTAGLPVLPYLFALRARHLLRDRRLAALARAGRLRLLTLDAALLHHFTGGDVTATDPTLVSRTLLGDPRTGRFSAACLRDAGIPATVLPAVRDTIAPRGTTRPDLAPGLPAGIPITASLADQSAAYVGLAPPPGATTLVFGTGAFAARAGTSRRSPPGVFPLVLRAADGRLTRALEANDPSTGTTVELMARLLDVDAKGLERLARRTESAGTVRVVPAASGLGAPHLVPAARAAVLGLGPDASREELAHAVLAGIAARAAELVDLLGGRGPIVAAGGGATDLVLQQVADWTGRLVHRSAVLQAGARGAALLAAVGAGRLASPRAAPAPAPDARFSPRLTAPARRRHRAEFRAAVLAVVRSAAP